MPKPTTIPSSSSAAEAHGASHSDSAQKDTILLFAVIGILLVAVVVAIAVWGLVGLAMWAMALVPVVLVLLVVTTFG